MHTDDSQEVSLFRPRVPELEMECELPTYEYVCTDCGTDLEVVQSIKDEALTVCPSCGGKLRKVFGNVGVVFKGSGFYKTDSRAESKRRAGAAKGSGGKGESGSGSDSGSGDDAGAGTKASGGSDKGTGDKAGGSTGSGGSESKSGNAGAGANGKTGSATSGGSKGAGQGSG